MMKVILNIIGSLLGIFKRLMCFLNIKRRRKTSGNILPMHTQVPPGTDITQSVPSNDLELESWDSWGLENNANGQGNHGNHSQQGTHLYGRQSSKEQEEDDIDFFTDMQPSFKKATKILVRKKEDTNSHKSVGFSNRLAVQSNIPLNQGEDLGTWEDTENSWADEATEDLSWEAQAALKEKRRFEREARQVEQLRKKQEREAMKSHRGHNLAAVKLS